MKPRLIPHKIPHLGIVWIAVGPVLVVLGSLSVKSAIENYYRILKERNLENAVPKV